MDLGLLSCVDQEKAFDRIDDYLFNTFQTFGFGEKSFFNGLSVYANATLVELRRNLTGFSFSQNAQEKVTLSAYADDVTVLVIRPS